MKSFVICLLVIINSIQCFAQQNETVTRLIKEGVELHDNRDYEGAIKKYDAALLLDKDNYSASYEKSLSCMYAKRFDESEAISKYLIDNYPDNPEIKNVYSSYGSVLDDKGNTEGAIKIYDQGIKKFPDFYLLYFNKGLTLSRVKKWDEALDCFMLSMKSKPDHPGSLYYAALVQEKSNKVAAVLSCLTFLAVEPEGKRAAIILNYLTGLMDSFASKGKDGGRVITINSGDTDNKKKENNFSLVQMMMGLTTASSLADSVKATTAVEKLSLQIQMMVSSLSVGMKDGKGLYWEVYAPFFVEMKEKEFIPVFAHIAYITSGNQENIQWINDNQDKYQAFNKWLRGYQWKTEKQ